MKILFTVLALLASVFVVESAVAAAPATLETAPTKFVDASGTHLEYRTIVTKTGVPLVFFSTSRARSTTGIPLLSTDSPKNEK